jgi:hypothetical protein
MRRRNVELIAAAHIAFPGLCYVRKQGPYERVPVNYDATPAR